MDGPFSPSWTQPIAVVEQAVSVKKTPKSKSRTPQQGRTTSPKSEFGYDDVFTPGGDDFGDNVVRKPKMVTRRQSTKSSTFKKAKQSFLAPTSCSTVKQRAKAVPETPKVQHEHAAGIKPPTIPVSPHFRARPATASKEVQLTSEELMLQKLEQEKAMEAERAAKAKKLYAMLKSRAGRRSSRLYGKVIPGSATKATPKKEKKFVQPRKVPAAKPAVPTTAKKGPGGLTLVEPFTFATDKRVTAPTDVADPVRTIPTAELAQNFMKDSRSHGAPVAAAQKITVGQSPQLRTKKRGQYAASRPKPPTHEQQLEAEMEEIARHPFKARTLDRRIFDSAGELGVPKVAARPVTEPVEFEFRAEKRLAQPRVRELASTSLSPTKRSTTSFRAKPVPKTTGKMPAPRTKTVFKPTVAMSPKFNGGARASVAPERRQRQAASAASAAPAAAKAEPLKITEPKEFSFATTGRGEYRRNQLQKQLAQEEEALAAARERKAQPVPDFGKMAFQPETAATKFVPTEVKPFNLRSSHRHADAVSAFQQEVQALAEQSKPVEFHARPVPATNYKPDAVFVEPTDHAPVVPLPVRLESERRAIKRQEFDAVMGQKLAQLEQMQETIAKQKAEQEQRQLQALRRKSVEEGGLMFKAKPIQTQDQFPTRGVPATPVTLPLSPQLRTKTRSSSHAASQSQTLCSSSVGNAAGLGKPQRRGAAKTVAKNDAVADAQQLELAAALHAM